MIILIISGLASSGLCLRNHEKNLSTDIEPKYLSNNLRYEYNSKLIEHNILKNFESIEFSSSNFSRNRGVNSFEKSPFENFILLENISGNKDDQATIHGISMSAGDDLIKVTPTTSFPWRSIVKLYITFGETTCIGSGAIIDESHVLTAGHCVYNHVHGGWADSIKVIPGMDDGSEPYGHAWAIAMRTYNRWIDYQDHQHDFAVITLDSNIGQQTGWMNLMWSYSYSPMYSGGLNVAGYPGDLDGGLNMYCDYENGRIADEYNHWYYLDTLPGMSGSPIWVYDGISRYIITICAYGDDGSGSNHGTRIDRVKFDCIKNWLTADNTATQRPDMISRSQIHSGFTPTTVGSGITVFNVWCEIQNIGTVSTGTFPVSYYASLDTTITESDFFLGYDIISNIDATDYTQSNWLGIFPSNIPSGSYYIGWIIDVNSTITEFKENNNVGIMGSYKLLVDADDPSNPTICSQINGSTVSDVWQDSVNDPNFLWNGAFDSHTAIDGYYYYWGSDPSGTSSSYTQEPVYDPPAVNNGAYYLRVCAKDLVGNIAPWTTLYIFKYNDSLNENIDNPESPPKDDKNKDEDDNSDEISDEVIEFPEFQIKISEIGAYVTIWIVCGILAVFIQLYYKGKIRKKI
ncbi:MAG: trypsin-like serine protease [Promethearchaeota archaeon]|nr:MAG: trypsin-like serine protease [Candidatus Lokiarchaeota archaeon]